MDYWQPAERSRGHDCRPDAKRRADNHDQGPFQGLSIIHVERIKSCYYYYYMLQRTATRPLSLIYRPPRREIRDIGSPPGRAIRDIGAR